MKFFVLKVVVGSAYETRYDPMEGRVIGDEPRRCASCDICIDALPWLPPYRVAIIAYKGKLGDLALGPSMGLFFSDRFRKAWEERNLRGADFHPVDRLRIRPSRLAKPGIAYHYARPQYQHAAVDPQNSLFRYRGPVTCAKCLSNMVELVRGFEIDMKTWQGEDLFIPWGLPGRTVVSDRVRQLRDDYGLTNLELVPTQEYINDPFNEWTIGQA